MLGRVKVPIMDVANAGRIRKRWVYGCVFVCASFARVCVNSFCHLGTLLLPVDTCSRRVTFLIAHFC